MLDVNELVPFLVKIGLTPTEFIILHMKYMKKMRLLKVYKNKFAKKNEGILTMKSKQKIIELGYMEKDDTREGEFYLLTEKFEALYMNKEMFIEAYELWDLYPAFTSIKGGNAPLMNVDKIAWCMQYYEAINGLKNEHEQVMLDTKFGIENGLIKVKISDYVLSRFWTKIRAIRLEEVGKTGVEPVQKRVDNEF
jgi:hypothetical protein